MKTFKVILFLLGIASTIIILKYPQDCKTYFNKYVLKEKNTETVIPLELDKSGLYHITVKINHVPMKFILDSGCSTMLISKTDANFLFKHELVHKSKIGQNVQTIDANGNNDINQTISIDEILLDNIVLNNIPCVVSNVVNVEPLLGQAVLSKLGQITIDYERNRLLIRH